MASSNFILRLLFSTIFIFIISFSSFFSTASSSSSSSSSSIDWWCNKTPHPEPCKHFMGQSPHNFKPKHMSDFRNMLIQLAMEKAQYIYNQAQEQSPQNSTQTQKTVIADCLKLYDNTIFHLNRTLNGLHNATRSCSLSDAQTWLSTALTNVETCRTAVSAGEVFAGDDGVGVGKMISNVLAINGAFLRKRRGEKNDSMVHFEEKEGFPRWISRHERGLLGSTSSGSVVKANLVVAKDGSGHFKTVQAAIDAASKRRVKTRFVIRVKAGIYNENIEVAKGNDNLMIVGDGMRITIITSSRSGQDGFSTFSSATAGIDGLHFMARDITFRNAAGPGKGQAVALRSSSDLSVFYRCSIEGYQDTLMAYAQRQFYRECRISGTVDFIFGNAAAVFQNCVILVRKPLPGQGNMITAQGRGDPFQNSGISIINSQIRAGPDLRPDIHSVSTYLGRPWQQYARVVVMKTYIESLVSPLGWSAWGNTDFAQTTCYFGEYENTGPGSSTKDRIRWAGYHVITNPNEADQFSVSGLLAGHTWLPATGVPFTAGV